MSEQSASLFLDQTAVHDALEALRQAEPLRDNPLRRLVWIRQQVDAFGPQPSATGVDVAMGAALTDLIEDNLSRLRTLEGVLPYDEADRAASLDALRADFAQSNTELQAWSTLYYRFVRLDLDLQAQDIATALGTDSSPGAPPAGPRLPSPDGNAGPA